jgi:hypothetical protein
MAKAKTLDKAVDELFKDYKKAIKVAAQEATEKAKDDLYVNAISCLVKYYDDYDPTSYNRTYSLIDSFVPYANPVRESADGFVCVAGVEFNPDRIAFTYSGSEIYTPTDAEWIISNFLSGIHPKTDGSTILGGGNYENEKYQGDFVPSFEMQKFIDSYNRKFDENFRFALSKQVLKLTGR